MSTQRVASQYTFSERTLASVPISYFEDLIKQALHEKFPGVRNETWLRQKYDEDKEEWVDWFDFPETGRTSRFSMFRLMLEGEH